MSDYKEIEAIETEVEDMLHDLDNGYVYDLEVDEYQNVTISFHTADGDEATLSVPGNFPLRIRL